ncbi:MAG: hypothetical protein ACLS8T_25880 [Anaerobutyricum sp.]
MKAKRQDPEKEYESLCEKEFVLFHFTAEDRKIKTDFDYPYAIYVKAAFRIKLRKRRLERGDVSYGEKYAVDFGKVLQNMGCRL